MEKKHLEMLNRVELRGIVGMSTINTVGDRRVARFSLITEYCHRSQDWTPVIDTTWHQCTAWEDKNGGDISLIQKGAIVHLNGRIRTYRFINHDGTEKAGLEIFVNKFEVEGETGEVTAAPQNVE